MYPFWSLSVWKMALADTAQDTLTHSVPQQPGPDPQSRKSRKYNAAIGKHGKQKQKHPEQLPRSMNKGNGDGVKMV